MSSSARARISSSTRHKGAHGLLAARRRLKTGGIRPAGSQSRTKARIYDGKYLSTAAETQARLYALKVRPSSGRSLRVAFAETAYRPQRRRRYGAPVRRAAPERRRDDSRLELVDLRWVMGSNFDKVGRVAEEFDAHRIPTAAGKNRVCRRAPKTGIALDHLAALVTAFRRKPHGLGKRKLLARLNPRINPQAGRRHRLTNVRRQHRSTKSPFKAVRTPAGTPPAGGYVLDIAEYEIPACQKDGRPGRKALRTLRPRAPRRTPRKQAFCPKRPASAAPKKGLQESQSPLAKAARPLPTAWQTLQTVRCL